MKHRAVLNLFSRELLSGLYCQVYVKCASNLKSPGKRLHHSAQGTSQGSVQACQGGSQ